MDIGGALGTLIVALLLVLDDTTIFPDGSSCSGVGSRSARCTDAIKANQDVGGSISGMPS